MVRAALLWESETLVQRIGLSCWNRSFDFDHAKMKPRLGGSVTANFALRIHAKTLKELVTPTFDSLEASQFQATFCPNRQVQLTEESCLRPTDSYTVTTFNEAVCRDAIMSAPADPSKFHPIDRNNSPPDIQLPNETWQTVLESPCTYGPHIFERIMLNFIKNPNVTSSHLFRADILYDSQSEAEQPNSNGLESDNSLNNKEKEFRAFDLPGWTQDRVIVRLLVPRNQQLDSPLVQTCILFSKPATDNLEEHLVIYIPHITTPEEMPFYHPTVEKLAFRHTFRPTDPQEKPTPNPDGSAPGTGSLSLTYKPFASSPELDVKLQRTALKLLQTIHKHGQGQLAGYEKRVHLDRIIPQKRYQDTYSRLKAKYGQKLCEGWVEVTDPSKHVFEDLGIAAFCLELWRDMYQLPGTAKEAQAVGGAEVQTLQNGIEKLELSNEGVGKPPFPGFVDIGCGNGLLVYILTSEGYPGFGFDARERKTWETFPSEVRQHLRQSLLVPDILRSGEESEADIAKEDEEKSWHSGFFPDGTFIISNHADELTAWTPLLAYLSGSAFIAIPCCSHDLAGSRFRAPDSTKAQKAQAQAAKRNERNEHAPRLPQQQNPDSPSENGPKPELRLSQAAETGSLKRTLVHKKMASAYSTLCAYVEALAEAVGFEAEKEVLRIPSTRNQSIIGRRRRSELEAKQLKGKREEVMRLVEEELGRSIESIGQEWIERAEKLAKKPSSGH